MGTQGTGRKRSTKKERSTAEDDALNLIAREAEARLAAKRAARAEAREIRMRELERQQKEHSDDDERMSVGSRGSVRVEDRDYLEKGSRAASALTAGTLTSLGGTSSRRGSGETALTLDAESSIRELKEIHELKDQIQDVEIKYTQNLKEAKDALAEVEEKYRKAMVSNAQLDNEKNNLMYQVDTLKDSLMELEEMLSESQRGYEEKVKELEREKHAHSVLQFQFNEMKETLKQSEELLNEIRQLRMKQEGFVREISDLQETVEWKDKKIGALERQKEYTDAIRIERDELREEVVKLKDILKKHGIVLGPDLNINGDIGETEGDGSSGADAASQSAAGSQTPPAEGNSMLGNTEETQLTSRGEEEGDPEQHGQMFEEAKENHLSSDTICNNAGVSTLETQRDELPTEEQQICLAKEDGDVDESGLSTDLNVDINKCSLTEAKDAISCSSGLQEILTSSEENIGEKEKPEGGESGEFSNPDLGETENKSSSVEMQSDDNRESCNSKQEDVEESNLSKSDSCPQQEVTQEFSKESLSPDESVPTATNAKPQQVPENEEEAENDEDTEEIPSKSQPQRATASGKKKKKKRRGKKKGGAQQKDETVKEKGKTEKDEKDNVLTTEQDIDETLKEPRVVQNEQNRPEEVDGVAAGKPAENLSHSETVQESRLDHVTDEHDEEQTLETEKAAAVENTETFSQVESLKEIRADHVMDEQNEDQTLETETVEAGEAATPTETVSVVETLEESTTEPKEDEQEEEQSVGTEKAEEVGSVTGPVPEADLSTPDLIANSTRAENTDGLDEVCASPVSNTEHETDILTNANVIHTDADESAGEGGSHDDMKSECPTNDHENNYETSVKEETDAESHDPSNDDIATDASESRSESKDDTMLSSTDDFTDDPKSLAGSEPPSESSTAVNSGRGPEEATETIKDSEEPETEQESFSAVGISLSHDGDNSELKPDRTENEELSEDLRGPEGLAEPDSSSHEEKSDSCDSASLTNDTGAFDAEKSVEAVAQAKVDRKESQTSQCEDHIDESAAEVSSETEEVHTIDMLSTESPAESTETGCCIAQHHSTEDSAAAEDPELKNSQNDLQSEAHLCPLEEHESHEPSEPNEPNEDNEDNNDSSQPNLQDSDEEDGEDEGQSFDFDDMDMDVATATNVPENPTQEEVDEGVEVMSDESHHDSSHTESNENTQGEQAESSDNKSDDGGNQVDTVDKESDQRSPVEAMSENVCEKQKSTAVEEIVVANEPITVEEKVLIDGELGVVEENIHQAELAPVEEGLDAVKQEFQGEALVLPKSADQVAGSKEPQQTKKDVKKNTKKGKAKGKEECKMS